MLDNGWDGVEVIVSVDVVDVLVDGLLLGWLAVDGKESHLGQHFMFMFDEYLECLGQQVAEQPFHPQHSQCTPQILSQPNGHYFWHRE